MLAFLCKIVMLTTYVTKNKKQKTRIYTSANLYEPSVTLYILKIRLYTSKIDKNAEKTSEGTS